MKSFVCVVLLAAAALGAPEGKRDKRGYLGALGSGYSSLDHGVALSSSSINLGHSDLSLSQPILSLGHSDLGYNSLSYGSLGHSDLAYNSYGSSLGHQAPIAIAAPAPKILSINKVVEVPQVIQVKKVVSVPKLVSVPQVVKVSKIVQEPSLAYSSAYAPAYAPAISSAPLSSGWW